MGLLVPLIVRATSLMSSIVAMQIAAALSLACMAVAQSSTIAIALYLVFAAAQWMSSPGLYNLLMNEMPDEQRNAAAAMTLFCNALAGTLATAVTGILLTRFGYKPVLLGIAAIALMTGLLFRVLIAPRQGGSSGEPPPLVFAAEVHG
jgi:predicted MFS family arabinose efflux permease